MCRKICAYEICGIKQRQNKAANSGYVARRGYPARILYKERSVHRLPHMQPELCMA